MLSRQQNKKKNKKDKIPRLQKQHSIFSKGCIQFGKDKTFRRTRRTYEYVEPGSNDYNTQTSHPGSGLDKRQCSLQVMFHLEGK